MNFKDSVYWEIYGDIFNFHKKYYDIRDDDKYWDEVIQKASEAYKKYEGKPELEFAKQLALSVVDELERTYRRTIK